MFDFSAVPGWLLALVAVLALFNFWGIWHAWSNTLLKPEQRLLWMLLCVFVPVFGPLIYLSIGLRRARKHSIQ